MISSAEEIYLILFWIIPGYFGVIVDRYLSVTVKKKESEFEKIIWSLTYSLVSYSAIFVFTPITDFTSLENNITQPRYIVLIWIVPMIIGTITGIGSRLFKNEKTSSGIVG